MKKLFVGKLPFSSTDADLLSLFEKFGPVLSAKVIRDQFSGKSRGFAFVELEDDQKGLDAVKELDGSTIDGWTIVVSEARASEGNGGGRSDRRQGGGGFGGGRSGSSDRGNRSRGGHSGYSGGNRF